MFEQPEDAHCHAPKVRSRRFPCKVMYMGIVGPPDTKENFDGKILIKRVSNTVKTGRKSYNQNFSDNYHVNHLLKSGEWRHHVMDDDVTLQELQDCLYLNYALHCKVSTSLVASYQTWVPCDNLDHNNNKAIRVRV
jgi:hypothetical protein